MGRLTDVFGTEHPVALVTGSGAPRVGNAIVRALAARGYCCVIHANRSLAYAQATAQELTAQGHECVALQAELTDDGQLHRLIDDAWSPWGRLDVLVNSAAIWEKKSLEELTSADVRRHFELNTVAVFEASRYAGLKMVTQESGGAIVNLGDWAIERPYLDYAAYFPSKGAIPAMTRSLAVELAARNPRIRVNAVLPGPVMLPEDLSESERQAAIAGTLVRREGSPWNVADAVVFLAENDFVTGVCLPVDGGRTIKGLQ
jgi:pteridine reductase